VKTVLALSVAGLICSAVAVREWDYRTGHPYALGPSGYIVALGVAGAIAAFALAAYIFRTDEAREGERELLWARIVALQAQIDESSSEQLAVHGLEEI
jgi:hypothetical protein